MADIDPPETTDIKPPDSSNDANTSPEKQGSKPAKTAAKSATSPPKKKGGFLNVSIGSPKPKLKDKVIFTRQLATLINAGVPLTKSLSTLALQTESKALRDIIPQVQKSVEGGKTFADALEAFPKAFDPIFINMVRAGEAGGILDSILDRLAFQQEKDAQIRGKLKSAMTYPGVVLSITVVAFLYLMTSVIPKIGNIIQDLAGEDYTPPVYTQIMLFISDLLVNYGFYAFIVFVVTTVVFFRVIRTKKGRFVFHSILLKIPIVSQIITKVALARFARIYSALSAAGVGVLDSLQVTSEAIGNAVIQKELSGAIKAVKNGKPISEPLAQSKVFPPIVSQMIAIGEETGEIEDILNKLAGFYEEEVDRVSSSLTSIIEPIMIVILGGIIGVIALSVFGPISSITQEL